MATESFQSCLETGRHDSRGPAPARQRPVGTQSGRASARCTHSAGGVPALPEASTPPTIAQVVSTSPPTWAVVQKAAS